MSFVGDHARGALLGLAVGDALGASVEFMSPGTFPPVTEMRGGGPHRLQSGQWTDDTAMALCLAESLFECGGFDPRDQMERYVRWWRTGYRSSTGECFDIGNTTRASLQHFLKTGDPIAGPTGTETAGNGSLMRLAPVAIFYRADPLRAIRFADESSRTTHGAPAAVDACRYFAGLLVGALRGASKTELLSPGYLSSGMFPATPFCPEIQEVANGSFRKREPPQIQGSGYVVRSLEAALWALDRTQTFEAGMLLAVNLGDDADTTGAVFGQIAGAYYGAGGIPSRWRRQLAERALIERYADRLCGAPAPNAPE